MHAKPVTKLVSSSVPHLFLYNCCLLSLIAYCKTHTCRLSVAGSGPSSASPPGCLAHSPVRRCCSGPGMRLHRQFGLPPLPCTPAAWEFGCSRYRGTSGRPPTKPPLLDTAKPAGERLLDQSSKYWATEVVMLLLYLARLAVEAFTGGS